MFGPRFAKFKIRKFEKELEPQEILLDSLAQKKEKELGISEKKLEIPLSQKILRGLWLSFLILIFILFGKTAQLQILEGKNFSQLSDQNRFAVSLIQAQRGVIYDKDLNQLVFNKPSFDFVCDGEIVSENIDHQTLIFYEVNPALLEKELGPGCEIKNNTVREYLEGSVFSHLIGYQRKTGEKTGLEDYYDNILEAKSGEMQVTRDVYGNPVAQKIISQPASGQSLVLHLDSGLQNKLNQALERTMSNIGAETGAAIALNPQTGGVLALTSFPNFDNNLFSQGMSEEQWQVIDKDTNNPLFNRVISGEYPTGSTIKPLIASAGLQENLISPEKNILCQGLIEVEHRYDPEIIYKFHDHAIHGWTDLRKAIAQSCNVYFYRLGGGYEDQDGLGPTRIKKYLQLFGWGETTQVDLSGEAEGLIPDPVWKKDVIGEAWWDGNTYYLSIGQEYLLATPIQVAASFAAIANGGTLYQPQIVQKILAGEEIQPKIIRKDFIAPENLQVIREGMREAVTYGSSVLLSSLPVKAAAKTGTAQTWQEDVYHNWLTVFAPYENPEIVLTIVIENVRGMQVATLPIAQEVLTWYFSQ